MNQIAQTLIELYLRDIEIFTHLTTTWYHWIWLGPMWYFYFFVLKWLVLTLPVWLPIGLIVNEVKS